MKDIGQALEHMLPAFRPRPAERRPLDDAFDRFAAETLYARQDSPPFHNSAMDGYAVRASELEGATGDAPVTLPLVSESRAGGELPDALPEGTAMRIFTGAPLPEGADAVVMQEHTTSDGARVHIARTPAPGANVRQRGEDLASGEIAVAAGSRIGPGEIGLLASQRRTSVHVHRRPVVAILSTGDELRDADAPVEPGTIVDSNSYALAAQARAAGAQPWVLPTAPDHLETLVRYIHQGLEGDVLLTVGGVSVGEHDLAQQAFSDAGVELDFWKVAIKPGKPLAFGRAGSVPVVGLPGNPVSAMVTFEILVRPGLRQMLGDPQPHPAPVQARLEQSYRHKPGRTELARARLLHDAHGPVARLHPRQGSGALPSMVGADALVIIPAEREEIVADELVQALPLHDRPSSAQSPFAASP